MSASTTMRAARLHEPGRPLAIDTLPRPVPGPGEVLVAVHACGLCGTDVHLAVEGDLPVAHTPITLGHEAAGLVEAVGAGVRTARRGDRVVLFPTASCGTCRWCHAGRESLCDRSSIFGMLREGSLAEYVIAPERALIPLPEGVPFEVGAIVTDGVATPFHALRRRAGLRAGESVAVFGCGGLGSHAVLLARLMGASTVVAVDRDPAALERARALGADLAIDPTQAGVRAAISEHLDRPGVDVSIECVGRPDTVALAVKALDKGGRAVLVGVGPARPTLPPLAAFVGRGQAVLGSFGMDRADIVDLLELVATGRLDLSASISARYPLAEAGAALTRLTQGGVVRIVVLPHSPDRSAEAAHAA